MLCIHLRTALIEFRPQIVDFSIRIRNRDFQSRPARLRECQLRLNSTFFTLELLPARIASYFRTCAAITLCGSFDVLGP